MPFHIVYGDITQMQVDAIVNAASVSLKKRPGIFSMRRENTCYKKPAATWDIVRRGKQ